MPYVTEATKVNIILPVTVHEAEALSKFLAVYEKVLFKFHPCHPSDGLFQNCLATKENVLLTIIFVYGAEDAGKVHQKDDPFTEQKNRLNDLEAKYGGREPKSKIIPWMSIKTDIPSQVKSKFYHGIHPKHNFQLRIMDVIVRTKKFATDSLFFLTSAHANVSGDMLNRCRMNAITGKFLFCQMTNLYR